MRLWHSVSWKYHLNMTLTLKLSWISCNIYPIKLGHSSSLSTWNTLVDGHAHNSKAIRFHHLHLTAHSLHHSIEKENVKSSYIFGKNTLQYKIIPRSFIHTNYKHSYWIQHFYSQVSYVWTNFIILFVNILNLNVFRANHTHFKAIGWKQKLYNFWNRLVWSVYFSDNVFTFFFITE